MTDINNPEVTQADRHLAEQILGEMVLGTVVEYAAKVIAKHRLAAQTAVDVEKVADVICDSFGIQYPNKKHKDGFRYSAERAARRIIAMQVQPHVVDGDDKGVIL